MSDYQSAPVPVPDWVMLGVPHGDEFAIYASTDLTRAQLESQLLNERDLYADIGNSPFHQRSVVPALYEFTITATMNTYVVVIGPSYAEALRTLLTQWQPKPQPHAAIEAAPHALAAPVGFPQTPQEAS